MLNRKCQFAMTIGLLSIIWTMLFTGAMARPNLDSLLAKPNDVSQLLLDELWVEASNGGAGGDKMFPELKKYPPKQSNYLAKWPGLRDLVFTIDYNDDITTTLENGEFLERLRQLSDTQSNEYYDEIRQDNDDVATISAGSKTKATQPPTNQIIFKKHNTKKNVQYMSPCHFKICNMGRKRNARFLGY
ncbi:CNMamide [Musca autumnalis]|uniref:CNMamide n=1 Tax=Musca autumnalis TaxID=221902 RepID=UPI003CF96D34